MRLVRLHRQQAAQERPRPRQVFSKSADYCIDLCARSRLVVAVVDADVATDGVDDRQERSPAAVRGAAPVDPQMLRVSDGAAQLLHQARLADPGVAGDEGDLAARLRGALKRVDERGELALAPDERRLALGRSVKPLRPLRPAHDEYPKIALLVAEIDAPLGEIAGGAHTSCHLVRHHDLAVARVPEQALRQGDRVVDRQ